MNGNKSGIFLSSIGMQLSGLDHPQTESVPLAYALRFLFAAAWTTGWRSPYTTISLSFSPLMGPEASRTKVQSYARGTYTIYHQSSFHPSSAIPLTHNSHSLPWLSLQVFSPGTTKFAYIIPVATTVYPSSVSSR